MRITIVSLLLVSIFSSCSDYGSSRGKKAYLGDFGDAMVVCDRAYWESAEGDSMKVQLTDYVPALMPSQGQLDLEYSAPEYFKGSAKRFRNVIYLDIGDKLQNQTPNIKTTESEFALDQLIVYCKAKTTEDMYELLKSRYKDILRKIHDKEIERKQKALAFKQDSSAVKSVIAKKDYSILVPAKYSVLLDSGNVLWMNKLTTMKKDGLDNYMVRDIVVTTYDYEDQSLFNPENLIEKRDEVLKILTYNAEDSTYVRYQEKVEPTVRVLNTDKNYAVEIRSVWTKEGAFEGGPSVQYALLDYDNRRIIHADARIYAPGSSKREMMRELEAIIKSIKPV